ncbi:MAG TPA: aldo/keto reductase [Phenylobacterium sp.]|jgi:2,5-diketo-D-gluconate reductase B|nr:aldo/keto reductase [Phenylobacterium sp.]
MQTVTANGAEIPAIGFGTYGMSGGELILTLSAALSAGVRHIDTAQIYRNEAEVGAAVADSYTAREDVFLTTKVWVANYAPGAFEASLDESLRKLRTDYVDLLLLHWPSSAAPLEAQIAGLNAAVASGKARHIGVSNFNRELLARAVRLSETPIATNQVEYHPYLNQALLLAECRRLGVSLTAYCGMAVGRVFDDPVLKTLAVRHGVSVAQIVLRWLIQQPGVAALSRTSQPARIPANLDVFGFVLDREEMAAIHRLAAADSRIVNPAGLAPAWDPTPALTAA